MAPAFRNNEQDLSIRAVPHDRCSGCGACRSSCPSGAVVMERDGDGFRRPLVREDACVNCGLCAQACPVANPSRTNSETPECYAVWAGDAVRAKSSSGGAFTLLAEYVLGRGGHVCGAAFDKDWGVHHIIINRREELGLLRGSKYVQSDAGETYQRIRELLDEGQTVLFSGCPCEVAGLYGFLRERPAGLVTVDIFCHCTASPLVWEKYLSERFPGAKPEAVNFRDKEASGWTCTKCTVTVQGEKQVTNEYVRGFHRSLYARESCGDCRFSKLPRPGDFTIGDWWGVNKYNPDFNDNKGTSLLLVNNHDKPDIVETVRATARLFEPVPLEYIGGNGHINNSLKLPQSRSRFLAMLRTGIPLSKALRAVLDDRYDVGLVGMWYGLNYGSVLTSHAMCRAVEQMGYTAMLLNKPEGLWSSRYVAENTIATRFISKHHRVDERTSGFEELNDACRIFLVGSDTVWNPKLVERRLPFFFLDFAAPDAGKIAYASSFGRGAYDVEDPLLKAYARYACNRLDAVAVREERGVELMREHFGREAVRALDPVFLIAPDDYRRLGEPGREIEPGGDYLFSYILGVDESKMDIYRKVEQAAGLPGVNFPNPNFSEAEKENHPLQLVADDSVENWLAALDRARLVVTDSFHAVCFSIILHKDFIVMVNPRAPLRFRFLTLLGLLGLEARIVYLGDDQVDFRELVNRPMDYDKVEALLKPERERSRAWLREALARAPAKADPARAETEKIVGYFKREIRDLHDRNDELEKKLESARKGLRPLNELAVKDGGLSVRQHLTSSLIMRTAFRLEYWRCRLLSAVAPGKRKLRYQARLRAVTKAISLLLEHRLQK